MIRESGEIGRRARLRGVWLSVRVQVPSLAPEKSTCDRKCFFQFYSPPGEWYCYVVVFGLRRVIFAARVWAANRISLQPQGAISLLRKQKYHADEVSISLKCFCTSCNSVLRAQKSDSKRCRLFVWLIMISVFRFHSLQLRSHYEILHPSGIHRLSMSDHIIAVKFQDVNTGIPVFGKDFIGGCTINNDCFIW